MKSRSRRQSEEFDRDDTTRNALIILGGVVLVLAIGVVLIVMGLQ